MHQAVVLAEGKLKEKKEKDNYIFYFITFVSTLKSII